MSVHTDARYYEPNSGRFLSADPLGQVSSPSLYDFAGGDPVNHFDPDGRCPNTPPSPQPTPISTPNAPPDPGPNGQNPSDPQALAAQLASLQARLANLNARIAIANNQALKLGLVSISQPNSSEANVGIPDVADSFGAPLGIADALFSQAGYEGSTIGILGAVAFAIPYANAVNNAINQGTNGTTKGYVYAVGEVARQGFVYTGSAWVGAQMIKVPTPVTIIGGAVLIAGGVGINYFNYTQDQQYAAEESQANKDQQQILVQNFQAGVQQLNQDIAAYNNDAAAYNSAVAASGSGSPDDN